MKHSTSYLFIAILFIVSAFKPYPHGTGIYSINSSESNIVWKGEKMTGNHVGNIQVKNGTLTFDHHLIKSGKIEFDMSSIQCTDLEGDSKKDLEDHLKDDDFFSVSKFPTAIFEITGSSPYQGSEAGFNCQVSGNLTIKGITNPISFPANVSINGTTLIGKASVNFDRTKWDIKYKSKSIFPDLGDKFIYDEISMKMNITANLVK